MTIKFLTILWASTKGVAEELLTRLKMFKMKDQIRTKNEQKVQQKPDADEMIYYNIINGATLSRLKNLIVKI